MKASSSKHARNFEIGTIIEEIFSTQPNKRIGEIVAIFGLILTEVNRLLEVLFFLRRFRLFFSRTFLSAIRKETETLKITRANLVRR